MTPRQVGKYLRRLRGRFGMSLIDLSKITDMWPENICRLEYGRKEMRWTSIARITEALGVDWFKIFDSIVGRRRFRRREEEKEENSE